MAVFDRGDIVFLSLEPVVGREMQGLRRYALVLTTREFNALGDVLIAPITQGGDFSRFGLFTIVNIAVSACRERARGIFGQYFQKPVQMLSLIHI